VARIAEKDFDKWIILKKSLETSSAKKYAHAGEIWWCSLGLNLGVETNGKNESFERPVVIMKRYNNESFVMLPPTNSLKDDPFHYKF
jgi:hypothetical protein